MAQAGLVRAAAVNVTALAVVPLSIGTVRVSVVIWEVYLPTVEVFVRPVNLIETAVEAAMLVDSTYRSVRC